MCTQRHRHTHTHTHKQGEERNVGLFLAKKIYTNFFSEFCKRGVGTQIFASRNARRLTKLFNMNHFVFGVKLHNFFLFLVFFIEKKLCSYFCENESYLNRWFRYKSLKEHSTIQCQCPSAVSFMFPILLSSPTKSSAAKRASFDSSDVGCVDDHQAIPSKRGCPKYSARSEWDCTRPANFVHE